VIGSVADSERHSGDGYYRQNSISVDDCDDDEDNDEDDEQHR
jgi:hypothetical protein